LLERIETWTDNAAGAGDLMADHALLFDEELATSPSVPVGPVGIPVVERE
jgi:hypothetical protein